MEYYDKNGKKISLEEWSKLMSDVKYKFVKKEYIGPTLLSTVWIGIPHHGKGKYNIFETMTFHSKDNIQIRYDTIDEAIEGHEHVKKILEEKNSK